MKPETDRQRYDRLQTMMRRALAIDKVNAPRTDYFQKCWSESEQIKNRNGGMPPVETLKEK